MRLAFLTHEPFYPPSGGGSSEAVYLVEEMVERGHEVHLFCPQLQDAESVRRRFKVSLHEFKRWEMGRYTSLRTPKYLLYPFFLEGMVAEAAREAPFQLIFSQHSIAAVAAGRLKRRLGCPVVMNFLDFLTGFMETWPPLLAPPPLLAMLKRYELSLPRRYEADGALTISDTFTELLVESGYPRHRIQPIYFGFDAALFPEPATANSQSPIKDSQSPIADSQGPNSELRTPNPEPRTLNPEPRTLNPEPRTLNPEPRTLNPEPRTSIVIMHGSLDHHHLGPIALEAVVRVAAVRPETIFRFVGRETPALLRFRELARRRNPGVKIECTGFVPYAEVGKLLAAATVGMIPYEESSGVHSAFVAKAVEYLAVGLPAVSTPLKSIQGYFREEPLIKFAGFDGASFAASILSWLAEPPSTRAQLGPAASCRVRAALDWRSISRRAVDFAEEIAGGVRRDAASVSGR